MKYRIPVYRVATNHGFAEVEASSPSEAAEKMRTEGPDNVEWDDTHDIDWWSCDLEVPEDAVPMSPERFAWWERQWEIDGAAGEVVAVILGQAEQNPNSWLHNLEELRRQVELNRELGQLMHVAIYQEALDYLESRPE